MPIPLRQIVERERKRSRKGTPNFKSFKRQTTRSRIELRTPVNQVCCCMSALKLSTNERYKVQASHVTLTLRSRRLEKHGAESDLGSACPHCTELELGVSGLLVTQQRPPPHPTFPSPESVRPAQSTPPGTPRTVFRTGPCKLWGVPLMCPREGRTLSTPQPPTGPGNPRQPPQTWPACEAIRELPRGKTTVNHTWLSLG